MNTFNCPHCGKDVELSDALKHQIEEQVLHSEREKHKLELDAMRREEQLSAAKKAAEDNELKMKSLVAEKDDQRLRNTKLEEQILEITREMRKAREEAEDAKIDAQRKIAEEEEKIKFDTRKKIEEEHSLVDAAKEKKLQDALKVNEELRRKLEQGSQQTQGEVLELEIEELLKSEFPRDEIRPVAKGIRGADVLQVVMDKGGRECGTILWESKNAKWSETWISKLKDDRRTVGAKFAGIITVNMPQDIQHFGLKGDIWVTNRASFLGLAHALRINVGQVFYANKAAEGKEEKKESLYNYFSGTEFKNRIEAIVESFTNMQFEVEREKRWYASKWARQEKEIRRVIDQTHGMYGELQGIVGNTMPQLKGLDMLELEEGEN